MATVVTVAAVVTVAVMVVVVVVVVVVTVADRGGKKSRTANVVKIRGGPTNRAHCVHPANNTVAARATDAFSRANWAALLDFSNCIFNRCRCRREDKNCLSSGARPSRTYTALSSPFRSTALRVLFSGVRADGCGSPPAAVADKRMLFRSAKCNSRRCGQSTVVYIVEVCGGKTCGRMFRAGKNDGVVLSLTMSWAEAGITIKKKKKEKE